MVAAGLQEKFSWKSVAAAAVSAAVSNQISTSIQGAPIRDGAGRLETGADGQILRANTAFANYNAGAARVTSDFISGITGAYIRHGMTNSPINFKDAAAESLGNALANEIVGGLIRKEETSKALAMDYSLAEGEAQGPGLRSSNRNASHLGRLSAMDNSQRASFLERSLADAGRTSQIDVEELPIQTVIGKRINPLTDLLTNYKPDFLGTARNWWNAYRTGENSLGDTIQGLWDNLDLDYKIGFRAANLAGAAGNGIVAGTSAFAAYATAPSGIGLVGFGTIAGVQGDAAIAKLQSFWEGERVSTGLEQGLEYLGVSERYAERAAVGAEFLTGIPAVATSRPRFGVLENENAVSQAAIRERVLTNIAESTQARISSNFGRFNEWPSNNGFVAGASERYTLFPGQLVDRYGSAQGTFGAEFGTSYRARALKPGSDSAPYHAYEVTQPIEVIAGPARAWFGYEGGGIQYKFDESFRNLLGRGVLREKK